MKARASKLNNIVLCGLRILDMKYEISVSNFCQESKQLVDKNVYRITHCTPTAQPGTAWQNGCCGDPEETGRNNHVWCKFFRHYRKNTWENMKHMALYLDRLNFYSCYNICPNSSFDFTKWCWTDFMSSQLSLVARQECSRIDVISISSELIMQYSCPIDVLSFFQNLPVKLARGKR